MTEASANPAYRTDGPQPILRDTHTTMREMAFRCMACRVRFTQQMLGHVPIEVFAAQVKALRCPRCGAGSKKIGMGERRTRMEDAAERGQGNARTRALHWTATGEQGLSAHAIVERLSGLKPSSSAHPMDMDDFRRCLLLLEHVPEFEARIGEMADVSPTWARLASSWPKIAAAMRAERPNYDGPAPAAAALLTAALATEVSQ